MTVGVAFGVDVGGSSIKHALVNLASLTHSAVLGTLATPSPATPARLTGVIAAVAEAAAPEAPLGVALPCVVRGGIIHTAANIDQSLIGVDIESLLREQTGRVVACLNDADAAGLAEMRLGAGLGMNGTAMMLTFGTGIGSALFHDGMLVPNTELGHLQMQGHEAEHLASARVRTEEGLDWPQWAERVSAYLAVVHALFWPELFIIGGGVSERFGEFGPLLRSPVPVRPAQLGAAAGVVGAAFAARERGR